MNIARTLITNAQNKAKPVGCAAVKQDKRKFNFDRLAELCDSKNIDPAEVVLKYLELDLPDIKDKKDQATLGAKIMPHLYPTLKAVEHSGEVKTGLAEILAELNRRTKDDP